MPDLGKIAYDAYGDARGWKMVGAPMPPWEDLSDTQHDAWHSVGRAVASVFAA